MGLDGVVIGLGSTSDHRDLGPSAQYQSYLGEFDDFPTDYFREVMIQTYPHFGPHPRQAWLAMRESASPDPASEAAMPAPAPAGPSSPTPSTSARR